MDFGSYLVASIRFGDLYRFSNFDNSVATSAMFVSLRWLVVGRSSLLTCSDVVCLPMIFLLFVSLDWQRCWAREGVYFSDRFPSSRARGCFLREHRGPSYARNSPGH
jgi:hypothetical protein